MKILDYLIQHDIPFNNLNLYTQALTHSSYANESKKQTGDYERLEFIGDAVLELCVSEYLYHKYPNMPEGELTKLRQKLVREETLARFTIELGLDQLILLGVGEEKTGGRERPGILCDIYEAFLGALYFDCGKEEVLKILEKTVYKHVTDIKDYEDIKDYKSKLQELVQADKRKSVTYQLLDHTGPDNAPEFLMGALVDGIILGKGKGTSKKRAEQQAAKQALEKMAIHI